MSEIRHSGIVSGVSAKGLSVNIINASACSGCHAQGSCVASDLKEKEIEITSHRKTYTPGQHVTVILKESSGFMALFFGYLLPFIIVIATLVIMMSVTGDEIISGLLSLAALVPYYFILYIFRDTFKKKFSFELDES